MKLPIEWLREFVVTDISDESIADALTMAGLEVEEISDGVFHTKVTPNRGDWLSVAGTAREACAALNIPSLMPPSVPLNDRELRSSSVNIENDQDCPTYLFRRFTGVNNTESPAWMKARLVAAGMRPVNAVVDITNYVMLEIGQPLHAFDSDKLTGGRITIRRAASDECFMALDDVERTLSPEILIVANEGVPVAIAGVMGGKDTEVTNRSRNIFVESAHFSPVTVRRSSKVLGLSTEASYRFERSVDPALPMRAIQRVSELLTECCEAVPADYVEGIEPKADLAKTIIFRTARVNEILGTQYVDGEIVTFLARLGIECTNDGVTYAAHIPSHRPDLIREIDIIEEVARMAGFGDLPERLPSNPLPSTGDSPDGAFAQKLRSQLVGQGFQEVVSHTLNGPSPFEQNDLGGNRVDIRQALSADLSGLRTLLIPNLINIMGHNLRQRTSEVHLFEVGKVFHKAADGKYGERRSLAMLTTGLIAYKNPLSDNAQSADFFVAKGITESLFSWLGITSVSYVVSNRNGAHPLRCADIRIGQTIVGYVAEFDSVLLHEEADFPAKAARVAGFELDISALREMSRPVHRYRGIPKFPSITRDLAVVVNESASYGDINTVATNACSGELLEEIGLRSVYTGDKLETGKKSVALFFTFRAADRTLVESEIEHELANVLDSLATNLNATIR